MNKTFNPERDPALAAYIDEAVKAIDNSVNKYLDKLKSAECELNDQADLDPKLQTDISSIVKVLNRIEKRLDRMESNLKSCSQF